MEHATGLHLCMLNNLEVTLHRLLGLVSSLKARSSLIKPFLPTTLYPLSFWVSRNGGSGGGLTNWNWVILWLYLLLLSVFNLLSYYAVGKLSIFQETVELYSTTTTKDNKISGEDTHQDRREWSIKRGGKFCYEGFSITRSGKLSYL